MEHQVLRAIASKIRRSIEMAIAESSYVNDELNSFPNASCEIASVILGLYLKSTGYNDVVQCFGSRPKPEELASSPHIWLLVSGTTIIDITADQFYDCTESVIVENHSVFHNTFSIEELRPVTEDHLARDGSSGFFEFYEKVLSVANRT